jgi:hypothetical protein
MTTTNNLSVLARTANTLTSVGSNGQVLTSNGTASYWANATGGGATGGGTDAVFNINSLTVNTNYTIASSRGAVTAGPIYIANGVTVTISANSRWVIL